MKSEQVLIFGVAFDLLTTIIGIYYFGLQEGNPVGYVKVMIVGLLLILTAAFTIELPRPKWVDIIFYGLGGFRTLVALINIVTILRVM